MRSRRGGALRGRATTAEVGSGRRTMESALSPIRSGLRRLRHSASFQTLSSLAGPKKEVTPLDWWCVIALQACSMISILSTTYIFSTAVFMVRAWGATDEAKAAAHAGLMIATKPAFSALSSYVWGSLGDKVGFRITMLSSAAITAALTAALGAVDTFYLALVVRALSGFFDGVMTLSKSAMAKISDRTNSAKAFSTFGVNYGLGSTIGPTLSALLAYPCGGDPNAKKRGSDTNPMFGDWCPHHALREYPFSSRARGSVLPPCSSGRLRSRTFASQTTARRVARKPTGVPTPSRWR